MNRARDFWLSVRLICAAVLMVAAWGLAAVLLVGFAVNPVSLGRSLPGGTPTWPIQVGLVLILYLIGAGCLKVSLTTMRRRAQPMQPQQPRLHRHAASPGVRRSNPAHPSPRRSRSHPFTRRAKLSLLASLILAGTALLAGMMREWAGPEPEGLGAPSAMLACATFVGALVLGVTFARRRNAQRLDPADDAVSVEADGRPVLVFIWWPITIVAIGAAILVAVLTAVERFSAGSGLPTGLCLIMGVFGFIFLPTLVSESRSEFRGRGVRGFWREARATEWGDGGPGWHRLAG